MSSAETLLKPKLTRSERRVQLWDERSEKGLCGPCGKYPAVTDRMCEGCAFTLRIRNVDRYASRKAAGICRDCGKAPINGTTIICEPCRRRKRAAQGKYLGDIEAANILLDAGLSCGVCETSDFGKRGRFIDHDHETGKVRDILCGTCNTGLGMFKDRLELLRKAVAYLERFQEEVK